ncbi:hypothetical protein PSHT_15667 [Puccinia striiformis]|uniref:Neprosin domain-containing protein n=1 Tax=Puccinia striiformis TaxID=27350 RepID=A0A2S4UDU4_9BASI|nr:hypothetical protein PSHT_15667 [Puccinia striiformis]
MVSRSRTAFAMLSFLAGLVSANWDPSTGYLLNHRPTAAWLGKNKPSVSSSNIQASECSYNTRLQFPNVQAFAWFEVNHASDGAHGCPYGTCRAYTATPAPGDMEPLFTDAHSFFWHKTGGLPGIHTSGTIFFHPASPKNGAYGYEPSSTGKFIEGPPDFSTRQPGHDSKYPGFDPKKLQAWPPSAINNFKGPDQSVKHPKCGRPCEQNRDPGSSPGAYGGYQQHLQVLTSRPRHGNPAKEILVLQTAINLLRLIIQTAITLGSCNRPENHKEDSPKSAPQAGMKGKHSSPKAMRLRFRP